MNLYACFHNILMRSKGDEKVKKSVLFLGGAEIMIPALKFAKEIGFHVILNDMNFNASGKKLADVFINFDSSDYQSLSKWVLMNKHKFDISFCYCGGDHGLLTAAIIHNIMQIPSNTIESTFNGLDKGLMKQCWAQNIKINFPTSSVIRSQNDLDKELINYDFPLVIKPVDSSGSRGVTIVNSKKKVNQAFKMAKKYGMSGDVLIEEYLEGQHVDVNGILYDGELYPMGIAERYFTKSPFPVPKYGVFPYKSSPEMKANIYQQLKMSALSMGLTNGPVKADAVICDNKPYIYEVTPRFHGDILTSGVMSFLKEKNPIMQLLRLIKTRNANLLEDIDNVHYVSGWRMIDSSVYSKVPKDYSGIWLNSKIKDNEKNTLDEKKIKNNTEILGLYWIKKQNYIELEKALLI